MGGRPKVERGLYVTLPVGTRVFGHGEAREVGRGFALRPFDGTAIVSLGPPATAPALIVDVQEATETLPRLVFVRMSLGEVLAVRATDVRKVGIPL